MPINLIKQHRFTNLVVTAPTPYGQHTQVMGIRNLIEEKHRLQQTQQALQHLNQTLEDQVAALDYAAVRDTLDNLIRTSQPSLVESLPCP